MSLLYSMPTAAQAAKTRTFGTFGTFDTRCDMRSSYSYRSLLFRPKNDIIDLGVLLLGEFGL